MYYLGIVLQFYCVCCNKLLSKSWELSGLEVRLGEKFTLIIKISILIFNINTFVAKIN